MTFTSVKRAFVRLLRVLSLILALILIGLARGCFFRPATDYPGSHFNRGKNAVWLGVEWLNEKHSTAEITSLANDLHDRQIAYVFVYTTYLHKDGKFGDSYQYAADFVKGIKQAQPDLKILAWIGLPLKGFSDDANVDLADTSTRKIITELCAHLVNDVGFDGIHLDPELVVDHDHNLTLLLDEMRTAIGKNGILSLAARATWPVLPEAGWSYAVGGLFWSGDYYREIAHHVDQIAVMTYDSGLGSAALYQQWMRFQVIGISRALEDSKVELLFGIPTSEEATATHHPDAENMSSALNGLIAGLNDSDARPAVVTGIAIYPYWETDSTEWAQYRSRWLNER